MSTFTLLHSHNIATATPAPHTLHSNFPLQTIRASFSYPSQENNVASTRRNLLTTFFSASLAAVAQLHGGALPALAENWGTRSFLRERFFEPGLSPEDAAARIRQTAEGLHSLREMLENMSWRYVLFYIRLKTAYLSQDLKNALSTLPEARRSEYVKTANELVANMSKLDTHVRTPRVYESYLYYEKTLKSIDELVALLG